MNAQDADTVCCGFCGQAPEDHGDSDHGPMSVCPPRPADTEALSSADICAHTVRVLKDRAESYWRDAVVLREQNDLPMAAAYEAVSHELRLCADILEACS